MDINNVASYMTLEPSQLFRAERFVEQGLGMFDLDEELTESYLKEHLAGQTLEYAMHLLGETTTTYMGVQIHNQGGKFSAPTAGVYGSTSRPELKAKIKEKILKRNERENKAEKLKTKKEEVELDELYKGKHGQTEKQYQDSRSDAGKMISGDSKMSGSAYTSRATSSTGPNPAGGSKKPKGQGRMTSGARADLQYRKANMKAKKEEFEMVDESAEDRLRDQRMERGGVDGNVDYRRPPKNTATGPKKKPAAGGKSAIDIVKAQIRAKYGHGAIHEPKKKNEEVEYVEEKKMSKAAHKKAAKAGKRWQDSDGDGKWYEPGQDVKKEDFTGPCPKCGQDPCECELIEQYNLLKDYLFENEMVSSEDEVIEIFETIEDSKLEEYLEQAVQMKGKKKGNVIINPEVKKVDENADASKKMQIQRKQLMLNKQKVALQQKETSKKKPADMHLESTEDLQEVDTSTRAVEFGAEIERTNVRQKKEKKSLKDFRKLSMGGKTATEETEIEEGLKQARKNVGADKCWSGYEAKGTKMKGGRQVPNCVKKK